MKSNISNFSQGIKRPVEVQFSQENINHKSHSFLQTENIEDRKEQLEKILKSDPYDTVAIKELADCFEIQGDLHNAIQCYTSLTMIDRSKENILNLSDCCYDTGLFELSLSNYLDVLSFEDLSPKQKFEIYKRVGNIHVILEDYEQAKCFYNKAQEIDSQSDTLMVNFGTLEFQKDNISESLKYFRKALQINIDNDKAWVGLGLVHREYGDNDLALGNVMRALDENVYNDTAMNLLIDICVSSSEPHKALNYVKSIYKLYPIEDFHLLMTKLYHYSGHSQKSWIEVNNHLKKYPQSREAEVLRNEIRICRDDKVSTL